MGRHSVRNAEDMPQSPVAAVSVAKLGSRRALREAEKRQAQKMALTADAAHETVSNDAALLAPISPAEAPKLAVVTSSAPTSSDVMSYAEYMNENLVGIHLDQVTVQTPRRFTGLFSRTRAVTATLAAAMLGISGVAMAATNTSAPSAAQASVSARSLDASDVQGTVAVRVQVDGETRLINAAQGSTVGEALSAADIYLGEHDEVSVSLSQKVRPNLTISVSRVTTKTVTEEFTEPHGTTEEKTDSLKQGERKTVTEGKDGSGTRTVTVYYRDGKEISRDVTAQTVTIQPVDEVVQIGTKMANEVNVPRVPDRPVTGSKTDWLVAAGIPESDWGYADWLVQRESGWNPNAVNSSSGACGLAQALPCSKMGPNWNDPVTALTWMHGYVNNRYGGFAGAVAHSQSVGWY